MSWLNCWFCKQCVTSTSMCGSKECLPYYVTYIFKGYSTEITNLQRVQFKTTLHSERYREYFVSYFPAQKKMEVIERITPILDPDSESTAISFSLKTVFKIPYTSLKLTPTNAQNKLPTLLTFS